MYIGIDLGTTYSLAASIGNEGKPILLPDYSNRQQYFTPSVVNVQGNHSFVGQTVLKMMERQPDLRVLRFFKRQMGVYDPLYLDPSGSTWYPEGISALVLKKIRYDAEVFTSRSVEGAVITIPAHFNDAQRKSVLNAAALIDLPIIQLIEEPVAAAIHYGISKKANNENILVYDLGGGTFDVTVMRFQDNGVFIVAKDGLTDLGGKEFDEKIGEILVDQFYKAKGSAPIFNAKALQQLRTLSEEMKIELCMPGVNLINKVCMLGNESIDAFITRKEFEKLIQPQIERTIDVTKRCLRDSGIGIEDISTILMVGGSSMIPLIKTELEKNFPDKKGNIYFHEPMKAVAFGAAIAAHMGSNNKMNLDIPEYLQGVTGHNLAVRAINPDTGQPFLDLLIKKNMPLPAKSKKIYYTSHASQGRMRIELVQYIEQDDVKSLGQMIIGPLPEQANYPIEVNITCTEDNLIELSVRDPRTGNELQKTFGKEASDLRYLSDQKRLVRSTSVNTLP